MNGSTGTKGRLYDNCYPLGLTAASAGKVNKIVAMRLQKMPMAHAMPNPVNAGFRARASDPKPLIAVSPASKTGFNTPATSC